jgi:hypothetical protein
MVGREETGMPEKKTPKPTKGTPPVAPPPQPQRPRPDPGVKSKLGRRNPFGNKG